MSFEKDLKRLGTKVLFNNNQQKRRQTSLKRQPVNGRRLMDNQL